MDTFKVVYISILDNITNKEDKIYEIYMIFNYIDGKAYVLLKNG